MSTFDYTGRMIWLVHVTCMVLLVSSVLWRPVWEALRDAAAFLASIVAGWRAPCATPEVMTVCGRWGTDGCDRQGCAIIGRCVDQERQGSGG